MVVHTCGKELGAAGALVVASGVLRDFMVNRCHPFIFATAPSPLMAVAVREALFMLREEPKRQQRLAKLIAFTHREIGAPSGRSSSESQIVPYPGRQRACDAARIETAGARFRYSRNPAADCAGGHGSSANFTDACGG
ncbi:7-keto-8-aminopelargonate synthetase-like enzyme [Bradyrhizobium sp. USDA 3650]